MAFELEFLKRSLSTDDEGGGAASQRRLRTRGVAASINRVGQFVNDPSTDEGAATTNGEGGAAATGDERMKEELQRSDEGKIGDEGGFGSYGSRK
ncbi:hypothetical protein KFK09_010528 [Dendrobium nobile]|uniref:Uncharacterized protein n=1 Tax=Dendrobium nobile TaxID=94219 RepID=A0A8T3BFV5_DENNO|nr:hypothetical protein KFK09_010528 [Dendrobium nobile]